MWIVHSGYTWKIHVTRVELEISYKRDPIVQRVILRNPLLASPKSIEPFVTTNTKERERDLCGRLLVSTERWNHLMIGRSVFCEVSLVLQFFEAVCNKDHFVSEKTLRSDHSFVFQKHMSEYEVI